MTGTGVIEPVLDPRVMTPLQRFRLAEIVRASEDIELPFMPEWNSKPCDQHEILVAGCLRCGVLPRRHQRIGITWLFLTPSALLADSTGLGKTVQVAGLLSLMLSTGEIGRWAQHGRQVVIVARAATIPQWRQQLARMVPGLLTVEVTGDARARARKLQGDWEVALIGPEMLVSKSSKGIDQLLQFDIGTVICDDIDVLRNINKTARTIRRLTDKADRLVICTATPQDKRLTQLYDLGTLLGWQNWLGSREEFQHRYVHLEQVWYTPKLKPVRCKWCKAVMVADHGQRAWLESKTRAKGPCPAKMPAPHLPLSRVTPGAKFTNVEVGIVAERAAEFRERIAPLMLRRTVADCDDLSLPDAELSQVWMDLGREQAKRYEEIRQGILTRVSRSGDRVSQHEAENLWMRAWQVTSSLANLDSTSKTESSKLDWVMDALTGDLAGEPVIVYSYFRATIADLCDRLVKAGVPCSVVIGEQPQQEREAAIEAFTSGLCNVIVISDAGGSGLNLQRARRLIMVDTPRSVGRVVQIIGRGRRDSSEHKTFYVTQLFTKTPIEESLHEMISREAILSEAALGSGEAGLLLDSQPENLLKAVTG